VSKCFTVIPIVPPGTGTLRLVLKQTDLNASPRDHNAFKKHLQSLETELEGLKKIRQQNILDLYGFKVHKTIDEAGDSESASSWTVSILCEFADKGSLGEFLGIAESLGVNKVRSWTIELLDALRYLHDHGIVHEDIHTDNILLVRESTGEVRPKLADSGFQRKLHNLSGRKQPTDTISLAKSAYWFPPEIANTNEPQYTQKTGTSLFFSPSIRVFGH
jgi:translation initiation factor 2-alpha kinase 4